MGKWLLGQGTLMLILGVLSTIVFAALHVRYAYALGVIMGLFNLVPVAGALVSVTLVASVLSESTGASFVPTIVTVTTSLALPPWLSATVTVKFCVSVSPAARCCTALLATENVQPTVPFSG